MLKRKNTRASFALFGAIMLYASLALAGDIQCPVCGQLFDDSVVECPNDATNLALIKKHQPDKTAPKKDPKKADTTPKKDEASTPVAPQKKKSRRSRRGKGKYKRHDAGGERQRADTDDKNLYSDRADRIRSETRGTNVDAAQRTAERIAREKAFAVQDVERRANFEAARDALWQKRWSGLLAQSTSLRGVESLEKASLYRKFAPSATIGARFAWMPNDETGEQGLLVGPELDLNFLRRNVRLGFGSFMGVRQLDAGNEMLFLEQLVFGYQWPWRYSPYIAVRGGVGAMVGEALRGSEIAFAAVVGGEAGLDCYVSAAWAVSPSLGVLTYFADGSNWTSFTARISLGF